jgi:hypothetical protein
MLLDTTPEQITTRGNWYKLMRIRYILINCYKLKSFKNLEKLTKRSHQFLLNKHLSAFNKTKNIPDGKLKIIKILKIFSLDKNEFELLQSII